LLLQTFELTSFGNFIAPNVKSYGLEKISDDMFLTLVGSLGSAANSLSRII